MFDIGWGELIVIGIVALIAIGPKELPAVLRTLGQYMAKIKRMSAEFQNQFHEALREADAVDLKKQVDDLGNSIGNYAGAEWSGSAEKSVESAAEHSNKLPATPMNDTASVETAEPMTQQDGAQAGGHAQESTEALVNKDHEPPSSLPRQAGGHV